jgi:hypothetical protein
MTYKEVVVGEKYTLRGGLKTGKIQKSNSGTSYIFEAEVEFPFHTFPSIFSWRENGRYLINSTDNQFDIVLEI